MKQTSPVVLIVDDDDDIRELMTVFLETDGYAVATAADGLEALEKIQKGLRPAVILLDLMMPRMDGEQFLKRLRPGPLRKVPVVIISGDDTARRKMKDLDADYCLIKPIELDSLLNTVKRFTAPHRAKDVA